MSEQASMSFPGDYKIMPVSVIETAAQKKRKNENHSSVSSRSNFSPFPAEVSDLVYEYFMRDKRVIVDPFAGWGERHAKAVEYGKQYTGFDLSIDAIEAARRDYGVENVLADSRTVGIPPFDGLVTCPPYWNLEKYADPDGIDRESSWDDFIVQLATIFARFYEAAEVGGRFAIMAGSWRKNHMFYDLEHEVASMFYSFGATLFDKVVISRSKVSKLKIMLPQAKRLGYTVRVHETLYVFDKTDG